MATEYPSELNDSCVYEAVRVTPVTEARHLSEQTGNNILLEREDLQPAFSVEIRGAYNKMARMSPEARAIGVVAVSVDNHAQGVAYSARKLGVEAVVVIPRYTPVIKVNAIRAYGAGVILHGDSLNQATEKALELEKEEGYTFIHPSDDPDVIAGQGTIGLEILQQSQPVDAVFVPVDEGCLLAGIAALIKSVRPGVRVVGVEAMECSCLHGALTEGSGETLQENHCCGEAMQVCRDHVDEVLLVGREEVGTAMMDFYRETRFIPQPHGILGLAGLKKYVTVNALKGSCLVAVISGANAAFQRLSHVSDQCETRRQKEVLLCLGVPDYPGSISDFCRSLSAYNLTKVNYRYSGQATVELYLGLALECDKSRFQVIARLEEMGYEILDLSEGQVAEGIIGYMVADDTPGPENERIVEFWFPEHKGALLRFLGDVGGRWYLTMFHYRNHGDIYGSALTGFKVPPDEVEEFHRFLNYLGFEYRDETGNKPCRLFMAGS